jgi:hypothetical protein
MTALEKGRAIGVAAAVVIFRWKRSMAISLRSAGIYFFGRRAREVLLVAKKRPPQ